MTKVSKPTASTKTKWYKVLDHGKSFHGGTLKWSLPTKDGQPGQWHEVEGDLKRCENGLHLTDSPLDFRPGNNTKKIICYEAEFEGDTLPPLYHELVVRRCRLLRAVPWSELAPSQAMELFSLVWKAQGKVHGKRSWRRLNDAMQTALALAIDAGMAFDVGDFQRISIDFNAVYWMHIEGAYSRACGEGYGSHGANPSAYAAIEHYLGRKPFLVARNASPDAPKDRLCVGKRFPWHIDLKKQIHVEVTSFAADQSHLIACSHREREAGSSERKIDKRFRISHADLAEYHAAIRAHARKPTETASVNGVASS